MARADSVGPVTIVTASVAEMLRAVAAPRVSGHFQVLRHPDSPAYYVGRDATGSAAVLIRASGSGRTVPLRLAGIEARFGVPCKIAELGAPERTETLTAIVCLSHEPGVEGYFASIVDTLIALLGGQPTTTEVGDAVERLVELFQRLREAPKRSVAGLIGELTVIRAARDPRVAVSAWRADSTDRFDFVSGALRVDAKASTSRARLHEISFEQANPPPGTVGLLASVWVEGAGGGVSVGEHLAAIEARLAGDQASILRLRTIVAHSLGEALPTAMDWRFDLAVAVSSLAFFDMRSVPAIRPPLLAGVTAVRFTSDVSASAQIDLGNLLRALDAPTAGLLPPP